jgi:hypothetical protein
MGTSAGRVTVGARFDSAGVASTLVVAVGIGGGGNISALPANALQASDDRNKTNIPIPIWIRSPIQFLMQSIILLDAR